MLLPQPMMKQKLRRGLATARKWFRNIIANLLRKRRHKSILQSIRRNWLAVPCHRFRCWLNYWRDFFGVANRIVPYTTSKLLLRQSAQDALTIFYVASLLQGRCQPFLDKHQAFSQCVVSLQASVPIGFQLELHYQFQLVECWCCPFYKVRELFFLSQDKLLLTFCVCLMVFISSIT